eukprot:TRINITY_DN981_c0_g1_i1.p1 TRINITY_DN981_c0_g1~~TRINITY_DN981_c0_g1_i1.p1  ORF type:complete len:507 (-),score=86.19 TRINITY_DN981_c0_g1_i1:796-2316(-)
MAGFNMNFLSNALSKRTSIFGLRLWVLIGIGVGVFMVLILFILSICLTSRRKSRRILEKKHHASKAKIPKVSKEIKEVRVDSPQKSNRSVSSHSVSQDDSSEKPILNAGYQQQHRYNYYQNPEPVYSDATSAGVTGRRYVQEQQETAVGKAYRTRASPDDRHHLCVEVGKGHRIISPEKHSSHSDGRSSEMVLPGVPEVSHLGWGHWYTLRELESACDSFSDEHVIGEGGYGIVYHGQLADGTLVAVKNLMNNKGQAEREFRVEVEAIGRVRHKNLVRLLGYCAEGAHRMLVYEYVDNGNLEQWLHGDVGPWSPLTWDIRMKVILGTAKGLAYLHEGLEPKVVHRDVKSSNILLDRQWNPKVSDFGLAKLIAPENNYVTTRVMGTFGYVAPEYASTGMLNERSDVYSFGVLIMEIITGRSPVDYDRPPEEVNLVDWLKTMVASRRAEDVVDPKLEAKPSSRALKRALLVALRCVDPDAQKRPKMGHVIHMLEADELPFREVTNHFI